MFFIEVPFKKIVKTLSLLMLAWQGQAVMPKNNEVVVKSGNSTFDWLGCNNTNSTYYCIFIWAPAHNYPPTPNTTVINECYDDKNCCTDVVSPTNFSDCQFVACNDTNSSLKYCKSWAEEKNSTVDDCYEGQDCCKNSTSPSGFDQCFPPPPTSPPPEPPRYTLPEGAVYLIVNGGVLGVFIIFETVAQCKEWRVQLKALGWLGICSAAGGLIGGGIAKLVEIGLKLDGDMVPLGTVVGDLTGFFIFAQKGYSRFCAPQNNQLQLQQQQQLLPQNPQREWGCLIS